MSIEDNDNLYVLEEELTEEEKDDTPLNYAAYSDEERLEKEKEESQEIEKKSPFGLLFHIMFNPVEGWKALRRCNCSVEDLQRNCFYPLLAILALSQFADYFYSVNADLSSLVSQAVVAFVAFFFGYFCIKMVLSWVLPKEVSQKFDNKFGCQYLIIALSTLALFSIITELLPMLWPVLIFLPIWTFYIMFKGIRFFKFAQNYEMKFFVWASVAVVGIPYAIDWGLNMILPK